MRPSGRSEALYGGCGHAQTRRGAIHGSGHYVNSYQQYLAKNSHGYGCHANTGVRSPESAWSDPGHGPATDGCCGHTVLRGALPPADAKRPRPDQDASRPVSVSYMRRTGASGRRLWGMLDTAVGALGMKPDVGLKTAVV